MAHSTMVKAWSHEEPQGYSAAHKSKPLCSVQLCQNMPNFQTLFSVLLGAVSKALCYNTTFDALL